MPGVGFERIDGDTGIRIYTTVKFFNVDRFSERESVAYDISTVEF